jgi:RNA polymerase sigma factor (sigma-70 family)
MLSREALSSLAAGLPNGPEELRQLQAVGFQNWVGLLVCVHDVARPKVGMSISAPIDREELFDVVVGETIRAVQSGTFDMSRYPDADESGRRRVFCAYVGTIVQRRVAREIERRAKERKRAGFNRERELRRGQAPSPLEILISQEQEEAATVWRLVEALPPDSKEVVLLRAVSGYSYRQIGELLNKPQGTLMSLYSRAVKSIRAILEREQPDWFRGEREAG